MRRRSPSEAWLSRRRSSSSAPAKNFATGERTSEPAKAKCARPFAPRLFAISVHSSISRRPAFALYSTVTGGELEGTELEGGYWYRNLRQPVRFWETSRELLDSELVRKAYLGI